jgi:hypothetical protein
MLILRSRNNNMIKVEDITDGDYFIIRGLYMRIREIPNAGIRNNSAVNNYTTTGR